MRNFSYEVNFFSSPPKLFRTDQKGGFLGSRFQNSFYKKKFINKKDASS